MGGGGDGDWVDLSAGVRVARWELGVESLQLKVRGAGRDSLGGGAGADENDLRDCWGFEEFDAEGAGGVAGGFVS
jgi:hypothetical protein